jgi:hypothetical protein
MILVAIPLLAFVVGYAVKRWWVVLAAITITVGALAFLSPRCDTTTAPGCDSVGLGEFVTLVWGSLVSVALSIGVAVGRQRAGKAATSPPRRSS